jgi:hypothetical protein
VNAKSVAVTFVNVSSDLHLLGGSIGSPNLAGTPISITTDIDGDLRSYIIPYIGADERTESYLPVEFTAFTAAASNNAVELRWSTATERNNFGFEIERKSSGAWSKVGFIQGNGTSTSAHNYVYVDKNVEAGTYTYRLKQVDRDGNFTYSKEVESIVGKMAADYELSQNYPNPFNPSTTIRFAVQREQQVSLKIYNVVGQEVAVLYNDVARAGQHYEVLFDAKNLASGTYYYVLQTAERKEIRKMLLMK